MIDTHNPAIINEALLRGQYGNGGGSGSNLEIKTLTFTGDGEASVDIVFPEDPKLIWITSMGSDSHPLSSEVFAKEKYAVSGYWFYQSEGVISSVGGSILCLSTYDETTKTLTLSGGDDAGYHYNTIGETSTVYYI